MTHLMGKGRYGRETYPAGAPPSFGIPDEIIRYYFTINGDQTPGNTYTSRPWNAADPELIATVPPPDFFFPVPVPPCALAKAALSVVTILGEAETITGDDIIVQWRGILGNNPVIAIPAPALGAPQTLIDTDVVGAGPNATITILNYDFSDVVVPLGGATIFPDILLPANLSIAAQSAFLCFLSVGIKWNASLINEPFGP